MPNGTEVDADLDRRRLQLWEAAELAGADAVLAYGANRSGAAVGWLTGWPVTREALVVMRSPTELDLLVGYANHVPAARRTARAGSAALDVRWCGDDPGESALDVLRRGARASRVATVGAVPARLAGQLVAGGVTLVELDAAHTRLRQVKSPVELAWLREAARLTDEAARALVAAAVPGAHQLDLLAAAQQAFLGQGGHGHVLYLASTAMAHPDRCVPAQLPEDRRLVAGDVVLFELSVASVPDYPGQLLRTVVVEAEPTPDYLAMHDLAVQVHDELVHGLRAGALPRDLIGVAERVRGAGLGCVDDLLHGLGGGYLPPVLSLRTAPTGPHAQPLRSGMTVVVQPNICTADQTAGVQTGEMYVITDTGAVPLHDVARGLLSGGVDPGRRGDEQRGG